MCTIMFYPETLPAEKRSVEDSRRAVDRLMEYDRKLSEDFTVEELRKLFLTDDSWCRPAPENYFALTDSEKRVLDTLGFAPPEATDDGPRHETGRNQYRRSAAADEGRPDQYPGHSRRG